MHIPAELTQLLRAAERVTVLTGAGVSAESGIPTFREAQTGLWARYDPAELATPEAFRRQPRLVWEWYAWRRQMCAEKQPNPGHVALARLEQRIPRFVLITQNVDGLHQRAGSRTPIELHGNLNRAICFDRGHPALSWDEQADLPPRCPRCGSLLRPDVVWFGETLPADALRMAMAAAQACQLFLAVGTSAQVYPAAQLPYLAQRLGATVVEINPQPTPLTPLADFVLAAPAGVALPTLLAQTWPAPGDSSNTAIDDTD